MARLLSDTGYMKVKDAIKGTSRFLYQKIGKKIESQYSRNQTERIKKTPQGRKFLEDYYGIK